MPVGALMRWVGTDIQASLFPDSGQEARSKYRKAQGYSIAERSS